MSEQKRESESLADEWESYATHVMPAGAGANQRSETRRAFYAGAVSMMALMALALDDELSDDEQLAKLDSLHAEIKAFGEGIGAGLG